MFAILLESDLYDASDELGALHQFETQTLHSRTLSGAYFLQIDEIFNAGASNENRQSESGNRFLKIFLTDGCQQVRYKHFSDDAHQHFNVVDWNRDF